MLSTFMADHSAKPRDGAVRWIKDTIDWARRLAFVFDILKHLL